MKRTKNPESESEEPGPNLPEFFFWQIYVDKGSNTIVFVHEIKNFRVKFLFFVKL